jgi:hypothetical protein
MASWLPFAKKSETVLEEIHIDLVSVSSVQRPLLLLLRLLLHLYLDWNSCSDDTSVEAAAEMEMVGVSRDSRVLWLLCLEEEVGRQWRQQMQE